MLVRSREGSGGGPTRGRSRAALCRGLCTLSFSLIMPSSSRGSLFFVLQRKGRSIVAVVVDEQRSGARPVSARCRGQKNGNTATGQEERGEREAHNVNISRGDARENTQDTQDRGQDTRMGRQGGTYIGVERTIPWLIVDRREREERHRGGERESQMSMNLVGQSRRSSRWSSSRGAGGSLPIHLSSSQLGEVGLEVPNSVVVPPSDGEPSRLWLRLGWGEWRKRASFVP